MHIHEGHGGIGAAMLTEAGRSRRNGSLERWVAGILKGSVVVVTAGGRVG